VDGDGAVEALIEADGGGVEAAMNEGLGRLMEWSPPTTSTSRLEAVNGGPRMFQTAAMTSTKALCEALFTWIKEPCCT
jgi:hypothetical protein